MAVTDATSANNLQWDIDPQTAQELFSLFSGAVFMCIDTAARCDASAVNPNKDQPKTRHGQN